MTALTQNKPRRYVTKTKVMTYNKTAVAILEGAFLTVTSGKLEAVDAQAEVFAAIADEQRSATDTEINVVLEGILVTATAPTGASGVSSVGSTVYLVSDTDQLSLSSSGNASINGKITAYDAIKGYTISFKSSLV